MNPVDLPSQDPYLISQPQNILDDIAAEGGNDLYFLCEGILGMRDLTPQAHQGLCNFIDSNPAHLKLAMMPRDHFKTSVVTIGGTIQKVIRNPNRTNLICNESATNSERMLRAIRLHAETNKVFRTVYSWLIPKDMRKVRWNDSELDFNRAAVVPEPTIDTIGMTGAMTSRHFNHMTFDDPISEEAVKSEKVMKDAIERLRAVQALQVKPADDTITLVGTHWAFADIYTWYKKTFSRRLRQYIRAAIEDDKILFPERFTPEILAELRESMGEYKFSCLMLNSPRNEAVQDFNIQDIRWWRWHDSAETRVDLLDRSGEVVDSWDVADLNITATLDPAPSETTLSDRNALTVVGISPKAQAVVLESWADRVTPVQVIEKLIQVHRRWHPRTFGIEDVAYQKSIKHFLYQAGLDRGFYIHVTPIKSQNKNHKVRQIRSIQPVAAVGRLYLHPTQHILRNELSDFPLGEHDDALDSLGMQTQLWHGVLSPDAIEKSREVREQLSKRITADGLLNSPRISSERELVSFTSGNRDPFDPADEDDDEAEFVGMTWDTVEILH